MNPRFVFSFLFVLLFQSVYAQSTIERADKEFELFAYKKAIDTYLKGIKTGDYDGGTLAKLADAYRHQNDMANAEKWYNKAVDLQNVPQEQILNFAKVLMALGKYDEAKQWFSVYSSSDQFVGSKFVDNCEFAKSHINDATSYIVENLKQNTASSDFGATIVDGETLIFSSSRGSTASAPGSWGQSQNTLYKANISANGQIGNISNLHGQLTKASNEGPVAFSPSKNLVAFTKNNFVDGTRQIPGSGEELNIFLAETDGNKDWNKSKSFVHNKSGYNTGYPSFSPDGKYLYFASDRPGGFGGYDIYVVKRFGKSWSNPENLGPVINSKGNEISPFFNGNDLSFSSDWHSGFGGFDVFRAEKTVDEWDKIFHLGTKINSSYDDYGFMFDNQKNRGYFVSNRPSGRGAEDIYTVKLTGTQIAFVVKSESTGLPIEGATIDLSECGGSTITTNKSGKATIETTNNHDCLATFKSPDFLSETLNISTLSGKRLFEISLKNQGDIYQGVLFNAETNQPVSNVSIKVTNQTTGNSHIVKSDVAGNYALALSMGTNYILKYSKAGFLEINQTVRTGNGEKRDVVKPIALAPIGAVSGTIASNDFPQEFNPKSHTSTSSVPSQTTTKRTTTIPSSTKTTTAPPVTQTTTVVTSAPSPTTTNNGAVASEANFKEVYSIQLMSLGSKSTVLVDDYKEDLKEYGDIYYIEENGYKKVRIGSFDSKKDAKNINKAIRKKGFKKAFVVPRMVIAEPAPVSSKVVTTNTETITQTTSVPQAPASQANNKYKVRLAAYKDTKWFDADAVSKFGTIEQIKNGEFTIMVLSGFEGISSAKNARDSVKSAGFNGAYVFEFVNGNMKRIE